MQHDKLCLLFTQDQTPSTLPPSIHYLILFLIDKIDFANKLIEGHYQNSSHFKIILFFNNLM